MTIKNVKSGLIANAMLTYDNANKEIKKIEFQKKGAKEFLLKGMINKNIDTLNYDDGSKKLLSITKYNIIKIDYDQDKIRKYFPEETLKEIFVEKRVVNAHKVEQLINEGKLSYNLIEQITDKVEEFNENKIEELHNAEKVTLETIKKCCNEKITTTIRAGRKNKDGEE